MAYWLGYVLLSWNSICIFKGHIRIGDHLLIHLARNTAYKSKSCRDHKGYMLENSNSMWLPKWLIDKESTCNAGDMGSIPGSGRSPGERNGNPLWCSCLGNPLDRRAWWAIVHGVARASDTTWQLNNNKYLESGQCVGQVLDTEREYEKKG